MIFLLFQNLLRNQAKAGCQTNFTYIPDIDMVRFRMYLLYFNYINSIQVTPPGLDLQLESFLAKEEVG